MKRKEIKEPSHSKQTTLIYSKIEKNQEEKKRENPKIHPEAVDYRIDNNK